jgi:hypothetical protein
MDDMAYTYPVSLKGLHPTIQRWFVQRFGATDGRKSAPDIIL